MPAATATSPLPATATTGGPLFKLGTNHGSDAKGSPIFGSQPNNNNTTATTTTSSAVDRTPTHAPLPSSAGGGTSSTKNSRSVYAPGASGGGNNIINGYQVSWWTTHASWFRPVNLVRIIIVVGLVFSLCCWLPIAVSLAMIDGGNMTCNDSRTWGLYEVINKIMLCVCYMC
jgi:hypothetical protein